jgi:hypothetical protein
MAALQGAIAFLEMHGVTLAAGIGAYLASVAAGFGTTAVVVVLLPEDYLERTESAPRSPRQPKRMRVAWKVGKHVLGAALVATGVVFAIPGIPGPGTVTILLGVMLLDVPGKRRLMRRVLGYPRVLARVNRLRARFGRAPLLIPAEPRDEARP